MRRGVLGGTFDPPHLGHLAVAGACLKELQLDEVLFLPANRNPLKEREVISPAKVRMEMVRRAIGGHDKFALSDMDVTRGGNSYAVDTLTELQMVDPGEYWFILGSDAVRNLPQWKAPARLLKLSRIAVVSRPSFAESLVLRRLPPEIRSGIDLVPMEPVDVSATQVRERVKEGRDVSSMVPQTVLNYIRENRLYES